MQLPLFGVRKEYEYQTGVMPGEAVDRIKAALQNDESKVTGKLVDNTFTARIKRPYRNFIAPSVYATLSNGDAGLAAISATIAVDRFVQLILTLLWLTAGLAVICVSGPIALAIVGKYPQLAINIALIIVPIMAVVVVAFVQKHLARSDEAALERWLEDLANSMETTRRALSQTISIKKLQLAIGGANDLQAVAPCTADQWLTKLQGVMDVEQKLGPMSSGTGGKPYMGTVDNNKFRIRVKHAIPNLAAPELRGTFEERGGGKTQVKASFRTYLDLRMSSDLMIAVVYFIVTVAVVALVVNTLGHMGNDSGYLALALLVPVIPFLIGVLVIACQVHAARRDEDSLRRLIDLLATK